MIGNISSRARRLAAASLLAASLVPAGFAGTAALAADMPEAMIVAEPPQTDYCATLAEHVRLWDKKNRPTVPARTPYYYCVTGETLLPGEIPPPPEYCCR